MPVFLVQSSTLHEVLPSDSGGACAGASGIAGYRYIHEHPVLWYLPSKCLEFIGDNYAEELQLPLEGLKERDKWTVAGLNYILTNCLIGDLLVFGAIEHESELFAGTPRIKCYPFESSKHHGKNPQVQLLSALLKNVYITNSTYSMTS